MVAVDLYLSFFAQTTQFEPSPIYVDSNNIATLAQLMHLLVVALVHLIVVQHIVLIRMNQRWLKQFLITVRVLDRLARYDEVALRQMLKENNLAEHARQM